LAYSQQPFVVTFIGGPGIDATSFAAKQDFTTGAGPASVSIGDLDGDGKADLAVASFDNSSVSVFRNTGSVGSISYAAKQDFTTGTNPLSVSIGDLDGDGKADLAVANFDNISVSVFRNTSSAGNISHVAKQDFTTGTSPYSVSIGDLDGDGKADLAVANRGSATVSVFRNTGSAGSISYAAKVDFTTGTQPQSVSIGDLDGDGKADLAVANFSSNTVSVFRNTGSAGTISYAAKQDFTTGTNPYSVSIGDLDGDGKADLAVVNFNSSTVSVFRNTGSAGTISYAAKQDFTTGTNPYSVSIGDLDGDGKADLVVANQNSNTVSVFRNTVLLVQVPTITSFTPTLGLVATSVTITGTNFSATAASNIVKFNGIVASITGTPTSTSIVTSVPTGATTGKITVEVAGQVGTSSTDFTVAVASSLTITNESFVTTYDKGTTLTVSVTVNDASLVNAVNLKSRGISEAATAGKTVVVTAVGNTFERVIAAADLTDPIGLVYSFEVLDKRTPQGIVNSTTGKAYMKFPASSTDQVFPGLSFGNQVSNYQIIAVPLALTNPSVASVFSALMPYDKTKWRLFDYASGDNREYSAFSTIDPGKGYWLIVKNNVTVNPGGGQTVQVDDLTPFTINLASGWNLIGNPYNFRVSWTDVLAANSNPAGVGTQLKLFSGGVLTDGTLLEKYRGAFVFSNNAVAIKIPVTRNTALGGRMNQENKIASGLDQKIWEVKLFLTQGLLSNELGGIGMHPQATVKGKDAFDEVSVPLPEGLSFFELAYPHPEVFANFNKEFVPTQENFTWDFDVKRSLSGNIDLKWDNHYFGDNDKQLMLLDPSSLQVIDMKINNSITLTESTKKIRILYGSMDYIQTSLDKELPWLGNPYPNPARAEVSIPFRVPESADQANVKIKVFNSQGLEAVTLIDAQVAKGNYEVKWMPSVAAGLYLVRMQLGETEMRTVKLIIK